jgi:hypothetical protein
MTADRYVQPTLARDRLREALREAQVTAIEALAAVLRLAAPASSALSVTALEEKLMLACRDVTRAVEATDVKDRPRGWDAP